MLNHDNQYIQDTFSRVILWQDVQLLWQDVKLLQIIVQSKPLLEILDLPLQLNTYDWWGIKYHQWKSN